MEIIYWGSYIRNVYTWSLYRKDICNIRAYIEILSRFVTNWCSLRTFEVRHVYLNVRNIHLMFDTYIWCLWHTFDVCYIYLMFVTYISDSLQMWKIFEVRIAFKWHIWCLSHIFEKHDIHLSFATYILCSQQTFNVRHRHLIFATYI